MSSRLSGKVRFFIDKSNCKKGIITSFNESSRDERGAHYLISVKNIETPISFYLSNFNLVKDSLDKLFIGRAAVAEAIASGLFVDSVPCLEYYVKYIQNCQGSRECGL